MAEINKTYFVSPIEAFQIVGQESFGPGWISDCIDDPESEQRRIALQNLRLALESGQVGAVWHDFDFEHDLKPADAAGEFFRINLTKNCIHLSFYASKPIECRINADDLRNFIRTEGKLPNKLTMGAEMGCLRWLVSKMQSDQVIPSNKHLWPMAKQQFPNLSHAAYVRARKRAIDQTGRKDLSKSGRRLNGKIESIT